MRRAPFFPFDLIGFYYPAQPHLHIAHLHYDRSGGIGGGQGGGDDCR
jgi:hypothetical protein